MTTHMNCNCRCTHDHAFHANNIQLRAETCKHLQGLSWDQEETSTHTPCQQLQHPSPPITRSTFFVHFGDKPICPCANQSWQTRGCVGTQQTVVCSTISSITRHTMDQRTYPLKLKTFRHVHGQPASDKTRNHSTNINMKALHLPTVCPL